MATFNTTLKHALRWLTGSNAIEDIDAGFQALAEDVDAKLTPYTSGLVAARPTSTPGAPGVAGREFKATDTGELFKDHGTGWDELATGFEAWRTIGAAGQPEYGLEPVESIPWAGNAAFCRGGKMVLLRGLVETSGESSEPMPAVFALPVGYRPAIEQRFAVPTPGGTLAVIRVTAGGAVLSVDDSDAYLDGISFRVA